MQMRQTAAPLAVLALLLALPASAAAATARVTSFEEQVPKGAPIKHSQTFFLAAPGEANRVAVTEEAAAVVFHDDGADVAAGEGCTAVDARTVRCARPPGTQAWSTTVMLDDGDDRATAPSNFSTQVRGGPGDDTIEAGFPRGEEGNDVLSDGPGNGRLDGGPGDDRLAGGDGVDMLVGGLGADVLDGGAGPDTASWEERTESVYVDLTHPAPDGAPGEGDVLTAVENLRTGAGDDQVRGDDGPNTLDGGAYGGDDTLLGGAGDDRLYTAGGDDHLRGDEGDDELVAGFGRDRLVGGSGDDLLDLTLDAGGTDSAECDTGDDVVRGPQRKDLVLGDCESVQLDLLDFVGVTPLVSSSTRTIPFRVVQHGDAERECGTIRIGKRPGESGRLDFAMPPAGHRRTVRVPVVGHLRTLLAIGTLVNVWVRFETREGACSPRLLRRGADETGAYRYQLPG